jgi:hypothetical protein
MRFAYDMGRQAALSDTGLVKTASPNPIEVRQRKDPFQEIHRRLNQTFKLKMPKFDVSAHLKRLFNSPFKQPRLQMSGKTPAVRM